MSPFDDPFADLEPTVSLMVPRSTTYLGPWCCEKGEALHVRVCPECAEINDGFQSCLGISEEEIARRDRQAFNEEIAAYVRERLTPPPFVATQAESFDVLTKYARIALHADVGCSFDLVGSVAVVGEGADYDLLFCASSPAARLRIEDAMRAQGFAEEGGDYPQDEFTSLRFNEANVLVTDDPAFFDKWLRAVDVCKLVRDEFGKCDRPLRVAIHQAVMD